MALILPRSEERKIKKIILLRVRGKKFSWTGEQRRRQKLCICPTSAHRLDLGNIITFTENALHQTRLNEK